MITDGSLKPEHLLCTYAYCLNIEIQLNYNFLHIVSSILLIALTFAYENEWININGLSIHIISLLSKDLHNEGVDTSSVANEDHIALIIYAFYDLTFLLPNIPDPKCKNLSQVAYHVPRSHTSTPSTRKLCDSLALSLAMPSMMVYCMMTKSNLVPHISYMRYRFPPVYVNKSRMCLGVPNLVPSHESTSKLPIQVPKIDKISHFRSWSRYAVSECWLGAGSNLFEGEYSRGSPYRGILSICNIKERKFLSSVSHSLPRPSVPHSFSHIPPVCPSLLFSHSVLWFVIPHSHCSLI